MKRIIPLFLILMLTSAQVKWEKFMCCGGGAGATYTGPGDVVSGATFWYGLRAYSAADRGTHVANVCNNTGGVDVACADVASDATTGIPPNFPTIVGVTCTNGAPHPCSVKTLYNKGSTGGDFTQATIAGRPQWLGSAIGSLPAMACASGVVLQSGATASQNQPYTFSAVAKRTSGFSTGGLIASATGNPSLDFASAASSVYIYDGSLITATSVADNSFHALQGVFNTGSSSVNADGTQTTGTLSGTAFGTAAIRVCEDSFSNFLTGSLGEVGYWGVAFSGAQISGMNSNQHTYWGF